MTHIYTYHKSRPGEMEMKDIKLYNQYNNTIWNQKLHDCKSCHYCLTPTTPNNNNCNINKNQYSDSNCRTNSNRLLEVRDRFGDAHFPLPLPCLTQQQQQNNDQNIKATALPPQRHLITSLYDYYLYHLKTT